MTENEGGNCRVLTSFDNETASMTTVQCWQIVGALEARGARGDQLGAPPWRGVAISEGGPRRRSTVLGAGAWRRRF
ncbi:hypothetical protein E3N88_22810 [Mikania micrantha]|uniref:Uncharacterized protein n=1 Tax=Mikania micrantha TaxID=192012 RepID=A0A5N6NCJ6_9ASTR|nr:hypothetical protein E3N88_22810 [Mikania micrantha]